MLRSSEISRKILHTTLQTLHKKLSWTSCFTEKERPLFCFIRPLEFKYLTNTSPFYRREHDLNQPLTGFTFVDFQVWESCKCIKTIGCQLTYEGPEGCDRPAPYGHGVRHRRCFTPEFPKIEVRTSLETAV